MHLIIDYNTHTVKYWDDIQPNVVTTSPMTNVFLISWEDPETMWQHNKYSLDRNTMKLLEDGVVRHNEYHCE
jgi:hypothetical protein